MADPKLRATPERLQDALHAAATLSVLHRQILGLFLARLELIEDQMEILDKSIGEAFTWLSRCRVATGRSARLRHRFGSTGNCGNRSGGRDIPIRSATVVLGGHLSRAG